MKNETYTSGERTAYLDKREHDCHLEKICADYVDKHLYKYGTMFTYERLNGNDPETKQRQLNGEDVAVIRNGTITNRIDEKAKVYGLVNKVITYPSFEILCRNQYGTDHFESWFVSPTNTTTDYAFISIGSKKQVETGHEWELEESDISRMVYAKVNRKRLHLWLEEQIGKTMKEITADAWQLLRDYQTALLPEKQSTVTVYREDRTGKWLYLKLSENRREMPVNLIIRRDYLRNCGLINELYLEDGIVTKYIPPERFEREEKLYKQN